MTIQTDRPNSLHFGLWALLIAATALGGPISAQSRQDPGSRVIVYADINFRGQSASFRDDTPNMASAGWNDDISSIRIPDGETWEMCQDIDYRNQCQALTGSVTDLRSIGWNDRISSLRRINNRGFRNGGFPGRRSGGGNAPEDTGIGVTLYVDANFKGQSASFRDDTPNLARFNLNDKVSSIRMANGETWEVCQDIDYRNQCQALSGSVADLRSLGWNDRISSLRRLNNGFRDGGLRDRRSDAVFQTDADQGLLFYDRPGFRGTATLVTGGSSHTGFFVRQGSVRLRGGGAWELCDGSGNCATIDQDVSDVSRLGLNGRITSAHIVNTWQYRRNR